jgi:hypothetical protein
MKRSWTVFVRGSRKVAGVWIGAGGARFVGGMRGGGTGFSLSFIGFSMR